MSKLNPGIWASAGLGLAVFLILTINTSNGVGWSQLFDNIFWAQFIGIAGLFILARKSKIHPRISKGLLAALITSIVLVCVGWFVANHGPRVVTEADHPASIRYLCVYYGDDLPFLQGHKNLCYLKNPVTAASNPAWIVLQDTFGMRHRTAEGVSQMVTFAIFELTIAGVFWQASKLRVQKQSGN